MIAIIIFLSLAVVLLILLLPSHQKRKGEKELRENWGKEKERTYHFDKIGLYLKYYEGKEALEDKTIHDLNIPLLYAKVDRCHTSIGQQYLYFLMNRPERKEAALVERKRSINFFEQEVPLREKIEYELSKLRLF